MYKPGERLIFIIRFIFIIALTFSLANCSTTKEIEQKKAEIAILMPLTGPFEEQGKRLAELTKMGIEDNLKGHINITVYDVATAEFTQQAAKKLTARKTDLILGPLFTPTVKDLENLVNPNISIITLSNNPVLADNNVFVFGHAPLKQTKRLFGYLFDQGHKDFVLFLPANKSSTNLSKVLENIIVSNGNNFIGKILYSESEESEEIAISKLAQVVNSASENLDNDKKPIIYLAEDNNERLNKIFYLMKKYHIEDKAIIAGDSRLDINSKYDLNIIFTGASPRLNKIIAKRFNDETNKSHLNYLEAMAYDLGSFVSNAIGISYDKSSFLSRLKSPIWFKGLSGEFKVNNNAVERKYNIIQKIAGEYIVLDDTKENLSKVKE